MGRPDSTLESACPWLRSLDEAMKGINLSMRGSRLAVGIDSSGEDSKSGYWILAILAMDLDYSLAWVDRIAEIRDGLLPNGREMSYKGLHDHYKLEALDTFLSAASSISGALVVFALDKRITHLITRPDSVEQFHKQGRLKARWKVPGFEKMTRIAFLASYLVAEFGQPGQEILWAIDEDDAVANDARHDDFCELSTAFLRKLTTKQFVGSAGVCTTAVDKSGERSGEKDFVAIPDFAAGAWRQALLSMPVCSDASAHDLRAMTTGKARKILDWFMDDGTALRKRFIRFESLDSKHIRVHW